MQKKERSSNLELLRIIAMFLIVISHYAFHGIAQGKLYETPGVFSMLSFGGGLGVCIFVLISGYHMINGQITFSKILRLVFWLTCYSLLGYILTYVIRKEDFNILSLLGHILRNYWFIKAYIVLMLLTPWLNFFLKSITKKKHFYFCVVILFISLAPFYLYFPQSNSGKLSLFVALYSIAAYIRMHYDHKKTKTTHIVIGLLTFLILPLILINILSHFNDGKYIFYQISTRLLSEYSISAIFSSILIFVAFLSILKKPKKIINFVASCTLGIYLFHEHGVFRDVLWQDIFSTAKHANQLNIVHFTVTTATVFTLGILVDTLLKNTVGRFYTLIESKILIPIYEIVCTKLNPYIHKFIER